MRVLDVGSGIGGPARTLASEFGCYITGFDLCKEYCYTAELINNRMDLSKYIEILGGNALDMPFEDSSFDIVFIQHVLMNIEDKERLLSQIYRVLHSGGRIALNTICAGPVQPIHFPVIWADNPTINFLLSPAKLRQLITNMGFRELSWTDKTEKILKEIQFARTKPRSNKPRVINFNLLVANPSEKWSNMVRNLKEGRIIVIQGIFERP
jgi:ubiquinone/menaquinone biosynthesis C-methylase UbiE